MVIDIKRYVLYDVFGEYNLLSDAFCVVFLIFFVVLSGKCDNNIGVVFGSSSA